MAQHRTSPRRSPKGPGRRPVVDPQISFTREHADRAVPYVRRIVADVVLAHRTAVAEQEALQAAVAPAERASHQTAFTNVVERLNELGLELKAVGVELRDQATGVVEFPTTHKSQPAAIVWELAQDRFTTARLTGTNTAVPLTELA